MLTPGNAPPEALTCPDTVKFCACADKYPIQKTTIMAAMRGHLDVLHIRSGKISFIAVGFLLYN
jgi:hypothetical protein